MILKILLTITLIFVFLVIILFCMSIYANIRMDEKTCDDILTACAQCIVGTLGFGVMTLATWIVWG